MILIGLSGKKQSGKDTVYNIAKQYIQKPCTKFAFADGVKEECSLATKISIEEMEKNKDTFRTLYQWWGTDFRRKLYDNNYWINKVRDKILRLEDSDPGHVEVIFITDVRFKNEADWIKSSNGFLVRIERDKTSDNHISECDLDNYNNFDYTIINRVSLDDLKILTLNMLKHIKSQLSTHSHLLL